MFLLFRVRLVAQLNRTALACRTLHDLLDQVFLSAFIEFLRHRRLVSFRRFIAAA